MRLGNQAAPCLGIIVAVHWLTVAVQLTVTVQLSVTVHKSVTVQASVAVHESLTVQLSVAVHRSEFLAEFSAKKNRQRQPPVIKKFM